MKRYLLIFSVFTFTFGIFCHESSAQVRYENNTLFIGTSEPVSWYPIIAGGGMYFNHSNGRFFQIDVAANGAPRLAGHNNEVVFYNTQTGTFMAHITAIIRFNFLFTSFIPRPPFSDFPQGSIAPQR